MNIRSKLLILILLPLTLCMVYSIFATLQSFDHVNAIRGDVFLISSEEVRHAADVRFFSEFMNVKLFELLELQRAQKWTAVGEAIHIYREAQQQRFHALQELKERIENENEKEISPYARTAPSDFAEIEHALADSDQLNEDIITGMHLNPGGDANGLTPEERIISEIIPANAEIAQKLTVFIELKYQQVDATNKAIDNVVRSSLSTLLAAAAGSYIVLLLVVFVIEILLIRPLENMDRALQMKPSLAVPLIAHYVRRDDELGRITHALLDTILNLDAPAKPRTEK